MISISTLRTARLRADLQELSIGQSIALCKMPANQHEAGTAALLKCIVVDDPKPLPGQVTDPRLWTVQERALTVAHYLAHSGDGGADFPIGDGRLSDYMLEGSAFAPEPVSLGTIGGDSWAMRPLLGGHVESIERLIATGVIPRERYGWWIGAMACQLVRAGSEPLDITEMSEGELDAKVADLAAIFQSFPESDFMDLLEFFVLGQAQLDHVFRLDFDEEGVMFLPAGGDKALPPARFPFHHAVNQRTYRLFGSND